MIFNRNLCILANYLWIVKGWPKNLSIYEVWRKSGNPASRIAVVLRARLYNMYMDVFNILQVFNALIRVTWENKKFIAIVIVIVIVIASTARQGNHIDVFVGTPLKLAQSWWAKNILKSYHIWDLSWQNDFLKNLRQMIFCLWNHALSNELTLFQHSVPPLNHCLDLNHDLFIKLFRD